MSKHVSKSVDPVAVFAALKPAGLDEIAHRPYTRRRHADLARALSDAASAGGPARPARRVSRGGIRLAFAAVAAAAVAAAGFAAVPSLTRPDRESSAPPSTGIALSADAFLLVSAERAASSPSSTGTFWHEEQRIYQPAGLKPAPGRKTAAWHAFQSTTLRTWWGQDGRWRSDSGLDPKITFPTPADETAWKAAGSPELTRVGHNDDSSPMRFSIGGARLTLAELRALPTDPDKLRAWLHTNYQADKANLDEDSAVYSIAVDLLTTPTTSATRAALYRILAKLPGVQMIGTVQDPLGRTGTAIARQEGTIEGGTDTRSLIIDPGTGGLLAQTVHSGATKELTFSQAWRELGWTDAFGG